MIVKIGSLDVEAEGVVVVAAPAGHAGLGGGKRDRGRWRPVTKNPKKRDDDDMYVDFCMFSCASVNASMTQLGGATALSALANLTLLLGKSTLPFPAFGTLTFCTSPA